MDPRNLHTASLYVNNLLLSRGLLRDGTAIEFAKPSKGEGGANATMAQIINLVHDLVLRRDRETETLSTLSQNMQTLRTITAQQSQTMSKLETRSVDLERQLALSTAQERTVKASLRSADSRNRALREDMARLKLSVSQIRSQCANDVRKRDSEIKRLKRHLEGRRGRDGASSQVGVVVITPGAHKSQPSSNVSTNSASQAESATYSLKEETNAFLTQLTQSLADENDALTSLVQNTLSTLRHLQGLPSSGSPSENPPNDPNVTLLTPPSYGSLEIDTTSVLSHLRGLLTNPSFVPLEEVEIREDEIARLRAGWERMEARWRGAVAMMDGWRRRMVETGDTINLDDLRKGLTLGEEAVPSSSKQGGNDISANEAVDDSLVSASNQSFESERDGDEEGAESEGTPSPQPKHPASAGREVGVGIFPAPHVLQPFSGNARRSLSPRKTSPVQTVPSPESEVDLLDTSDELALEYDATPSKKKGKPIQSDFSGQISEAPLSVQQKLALAEQEAERARKRLPVVGKREGGRGTGSGERKTGLPRAKARVGRRRSTLSPEELEGLMGLV